MKLSEVTASMVDGDQHVHLKDEVDAELDTMETWNGTEFFIRAITQAKILLHLGANADYVMAGLLKCGLRRGWYLHEDGNITESFTTALGLTEQDMKDIQKEIRPQ